MKLPKKINRNYRLIGVIHHRGRSSNSGHYYCYNLVEGKSGPEWILFDDDTVVRVKQSSNPEELPEEILMSAHSGTAYLLSYQRMDVPLKKYLPKFIDASINSILNTNHENFRFTLYKFTI